MNIKIFFTTLIFLCSLTFSNAQEDLLDELDTIKSEKKEIEKMAFKGLQICNLQSTKTAAKGEWYFMVSHRFGDLTQGFDNFFGFDNAFTKIGGIYGINDWLSVAGTRHTYKKTYEVAVKYKLKSQEFDGFPLTIVGYNTVNINSELKKTLYPNLIFNDRLSYSSQLLVSRKFSDKFSLEIAPIFIHKNLYDGLIDRKNQFLIAAGGRYKLTKRLSVNLEYAARTMVSKYTKLVYSNPLTIGLDIETGGHVFQLVFSNSQQMNDVAVFTNTYGNWNGGGIYFGFNMYRVFN